MSDHTLTLISTWAEVAILLFMVWEHYGPSVMRTRPISPGSAGFLGQIWENRTLIVAVMGLAIVGWLYLWRFPSSDESRQSTLIGWLEQSQHDRADAKQDVAAVEAQKATLIEWLQWAQRERDDARQGAAAAEAQKNTLIDWLEQAQRERNHATQERDHLRTQLQSAPPQQPINSKEQECVKLSRQLLTGATEMGYDFSEEYRKRVESAMSMLNCPNK